MMFIRVWAGVGGGDISRCAWFENVVHFPVSIPELGQTWDRLHVSLNVVIYKPASLLSFLSRDHSYFIVFRTQIGVFNIRGALIYIL